MPLAPHLQLVANSIRDGRVIPFLGAGVNLCGRPQGSSFERGRYLPSGGELARYLAQEFGYPPDESVDLVRVSQYAATAIGYGPLYEKLRALFDSDYPPTALHTMLASMPILLRARGYPVRPQLIVTTNYDDALENAFRAVDEPFDLVSYVADGEDRGKFLHTSPAGVVALIERPNEYRGLSLEERGVILKIHGAVDRGDAERDSYVITEDHYIDFLTRTDISNLIPVVLAAKLRRSNFLFLGYSLRDWNLRVILHRIWGERQLSWKSWAVLLDPHPVEQAYWRTRGVDLIDMRLEEYTVQLTAALEALPAMVAAP